MSTPDPEIEFFPREDWWPTVASVAALIRVRTRLLGTREGGLAGTFLNPAVPGGAERTRPNADQAEESIRAAVLELWAASGSRRPCSEGLRAAAGSFVKYRAAQLIEISYYPEISEGQTSAAEAFGRLADPLLERLSRHIAERCREDEPDDGTGALVVGAKGIAPCRTRTGFVDPRAW